EGEQQHRAGAEREDDGEERAHADVHGAVGETRPLRRPRRRQRHLAADGLRAHTDTAPPTEAWPLLTVPGTVKTEARNAPPRRVFTVPGMVKRRVRRPAAPVRASIEGSDVSPAPALRRAGPEAMGQAEACSFVTRACPFVTRACSFVTRARSFLTPPPPPRRPPSAARSPRPPRGRWGRCRRSGRGRAPRSGRLCRGARRGLWRSRARRRRGRRAA